MTPTVYSRDSDAGCLHVDDQTVALVLGSSASTVCQVSRITEIPTTPISCSISPRTADYAQGTQD